MDIVVGVRVRVLPGRRFPAFEAGDTGEVVCVDRESKTCDVIFDGRANGCRSGNMPVQVAMRYLEVIDKDRPPIDQKPNGGAAVAGDGAENVGPMGVVGCGSSSSTSRPVTPASLRQHAVPSVAVEPGEAFGGRHVDGCSIVGEPIQSSSSSLSRGHALSCNSGGAETCDDLLSRVVVLEVTSSSQHRALSSLEARLAACEAAVTVAGADGGSEGIAANGSAVSSGRLVAARVAALEGAHQAEVAVLRRDLDDAVALGREHEKLFKKHRASARESEHLLDESEIRIAALRDSSRTLREELQTMSSDLENQERRAVGLGELVGAATVGIARVDSMLDRKDRLARALDESLCSTPATLENLSVCVEEQTNRVCNLESRIDILRRRIEDLDGAARRTPMPDNEPLWQALRELQELVVHESEHRAAGLREVLAVLGQGVEQLRGEQARHMSDMEERAREEQRQVKLQLAEALSLRSQWEKKTTTLDGRVEEIYRAFQAERNARAEAVALLEEQVREVRALHAKTRCLSPISAPHSVADAKADIASDIVTSSSMQRLEALEARFDKNAHPLPPPPLNVQYAGANVGSRCTEGTLGKLREQLVGLQSELVVPPGALDAVVVPEGAMRPVTSQVARCRSAASMPKPTPSAAFPSLRPLALPTSSAPTTGPVATTLQPTTFTVSPGASPRVVANSEGMQAQAVESEPAPAPAPALSVASFVATSAQVLQPHTKQYQLLQDGEACVCGHVFAAGASYCRRCGLKRPDASMSEPLGPAACPTVPRAAVAPAHHVQVLTPAVVPAADTSAVAAGASG